MKYFVSYSHAGPRASGFGSATYTTPGPMTEDILNEIREDIARTHPADMRIVILNFQPFA
jgi:hypothetical protein